MNDEKIKVRVTENGQTNKGVRAEISYDVNEARIADERGKLGAHA
jgi:hypothetical protein